MATKQIMEASKAVATAVMQCKPDVIPMYPITPQTHIVERIADFVNDGDLDAEVIYADSEFTAISATMGASATGVRAFTATCSQGLALMHEVLHSVSGTRLPVVVAVANRALASPINIWNDHQDSMNARDTGFMQMYVESSQEAYDTMIQAFKVAEDEKVLLPIMVCLDGFTLSHVYEPLYVESKSQISSFVGKYKPKHIFLDPKKPMTIGPIGYPDTFIKFKKAQEDAMKNALTVIKKVNSDYKKKFKRGYGNGLVEAYKMKDANYVVIGLGTVCGTIRTVVDELRKEGKKVGLLKIKTYRPFPSKDIIKHCSKLKGLGIIDKCASFGHNAPVYSDVTSDLKDKDVIVNGFIAGLGGKDITKDDIKKIFNDLRKQKKVQWFD